VYAIDTTQSPPSTLAHHGTWLYANGELTLRFTASDFAVNGTFAVDLSASETTMPFKVLSGSAGSSTWLRTAPPLAQSLLDVYNAALDDTDLNLTPTQAVGRAYMYATAWLPLQSQVVHAPRLASASRACPGTAREMIKSVVDLSDAIRMESDCGTLEDILVSAIGGPGESLGVAPLAGDPRVHLNEQTPDNAAADPASKTAVIFSPFVTSSGNVIGSAVVREDDINQVVSTLKADHYADPVELLNKDATIANLYETLVKLRNPGVIIIETHGDADGDIATYDGSQCMTRPGLHPTELPPQLENMDTYCANIDTQTYPISHTLIPPAFWDYLRSAGVNFHHTLVYIDGCDVDAGALWSSGTPMKGKKLNIRSAQKTPIPQQPALLARTIQAGAFVAYNGHIGTTAGPAVMRYLITALARKTHSAEETFYNLLRVANTGQMIYTEDALLNNTLQKPAPTTPGGDVYDLLDAYGWNGAREISYWGHGWENGKLNPAQVWWLLFAERWSPQPKTGAANIESCEQYWSHGDLGGLKSVFCQNANIGKPPTRAEVNYARYLQLGTPTPTSAVPRWTMNDGT
jgi:hypothetical protein